MSIGGERVPEDPQFFPMGLGEEGEGFRIHRLPSSSFHLARTLRTTDIPAGWGGQGESIHPEGTLEGWGGFHQTQV